MKINKKILLGMFFLFGILLALSFISSTYIRSGVQHVAPGVSFVGAGPDVMIDQEMCRQAGQDFIVQIAPFGCTPAVVRSDLLEEQNVPVFCQLAATKINPLIKVEAIDTIYFSGKYPREIAGIGFHPAKAALGVRTKLNSPALNNIGYVVIVLRRQPDESAMPDFVQGNLTAKIRYDIKNAWGIGQANYYLPVLSDSDFDEKYKNYGFWRGKGYLRAEAIDQDTASISVYSDVSGIRSAKKRLTSVNLRKGQLSNKIYLPGLGFCLASLQVKLNSVEAPDARARLKINADVFEVAQGERFLENRCQAIKVQKIGVLEKTKMRCYKDDNRPVVFDFMINPKINLSIDGESREVEVGERLGYTGDGKVVYLGYIGTEAYSQQKEDLKIYLVAIPEDKPKLSEQELGAIGDIAGAYEDSGEVKAGVPFVEFIRKKGEQAFVGIARDYFGRLFKGRDIKRIEFSEEKEVFGKAIKIIDFAEPTDIELPDNVSLRNYYEKATSDFDTVIDSYSDEKHIEDESLVLGEESLSKKIELARGVGQNRGVVELCEEFREKYPDSDEPGICEDEYKLASSTITTKDILINNMLKSISFEGIYEPTFEDYGAKVIVRYPDSTRTRFNLRKNQRIYLDENSTEYLQLASVKEDSAKLEILTKVETDLERIKQITSSRIENFKVNEQKAFGDYSFTLVETNLKRIASVSVVPSINYAGSNASFGFKIGIEKRAIDLSPTKIKKKIEKLDKSIEKWQKTADWLGKRVEQGKTACLAVGGGLTLINFWENAKGKGLARQIIMRSANGWYGLCTDMVNAGDFVSQDHCLSAKAALIERDVNKLTEIMGSLNKIIKEIEKRHLIEPKGLKKLLSLEKVVNTDEFMEEYADGHFIPGVLEDFKEQLGGKFLDPDGKGEDISLEHMAEFLSYEGWKNNSYYNTAQLRDIEVYIGVLGSDDVSPELEKIARKSLYSLFSDVEANAGDYLRLKEAQEKAKEKGFPGVTFRPYRDETKKEEIYDGLVAPKNLGNLEKGEMFQGILFNNIEYYVTLESIGSKMYKIKEVYNSSGIEIDEALSEEIKNTYSHFKKYDRSTYENEFKNAEVRYYEIGQYKGFPAIVPFDLNNGWYAAMKSTTPALGESRSFDVSGIVTNFYLCNVGENGLAEFFSSIGDDDCQGIYLDERRSYTQFSGLSENEAFYLAQDASNAISQAQRAYQSGLGDKVKISTKRGTFYVDVGEPALGLPDIQCQDFMSPGNCKTLFNFCDPVVCPSSRCNFGGTYHVKDVVQSGIFGSLALCLPNFVGFGGDVYVPVCLSGIHAGIKGWLFVEKSYQECLQHSLETGETIGICDEIYSVYGCDFFWRQALPITKIAVPKLVSMILKQNVRGGGEYLSVRDAFTRAGSSLTWFTQYYAEETTRAFKARSTQEMAGSAVCKAYMSIVVPSGGKFLKALTKPDVPSQFHGRFDEIPFTTVTSPPISHYKVFYHIYAGEDTPAYYRVYLMPGPGGSFYQDTTAIRFVAGGFIPKGEYRSDTQDFTAPAGYQQMCINVNGQEECGFKQVSTSFAVDYLEDTYLAGQAGARDIKTEKECRSGTPNLYVLANPNLQAGAEEAIDPAIYNRGIVRICATNNPGLSTDAYAKQEGSRWLEVGYCDDPKMKCWLDKKSVEDVIDAPDIAKYLTNGTIQTLDEAVLQEVEDNYMNILIEEGKYLEAEEFGEKIEEIGEPEKNPKQKIRIISDIINKVFFNQQKAYLHFLRGRAYARLAMDLYEQLKPEGEPEREITFVSPVFEFEDGTTKDNLFYRYYKGKWQFSLDKFKWINVSSNPQYTERVIVGHIKGEPQYRTEIREPSKKDKEFIKNLEGKSYSEGLKLLIDRTSADKEGGWFSNPNLVTKDVNMDEEGLFIVEQKAGTIYFEYREEWYWSLERRVWELVSEPIEGDELMGSLEGKDFYEGAMIIFGGEYVGVSVSEEELEEDVKGRTKWTLDSSIEKVRELRGKYSDNKIFVDQLFEDGILTEKEYDDITGGSAWDIGIFNKEGDMEDLYDLLRRKHSEEETEQPLMAQELCQQQIGEEILRVAREKKTRYNIDDELVKRDAGARNFECLVLQVAMQESQIQHCKENRNGDCLYCNGKIDEVLKSGGDEQSYGVMQINKEVHTNVIVENFEENVNFGIDYLITRYNPNPKSYGCAGKNYEGWKRALRFYNGWNTDCSKGNINYVEEATGERNRIIGGEQKNVKEEVIKLFPECGEEGEKTQILFKSAEICPKIEYTCVLEDNLNINLDEEDTIFITLNGQAVPDSVIKVKTQDDTLITVSTDSFGQTEKSSERMVWTLENAIEKVKTLRGKYSDNKDFVDQLFEDRILTEDEYKEINGEGWFNAQEDMNYLKNLLLQKLISSGQAEDERVTGD